MKKRGFKPLIALLCSFVFLTSCEKKDKDEEANRAQRANIVETGEIAAVNSKSFVLQRFGRYWFDMRVIGILEHGTIVNAGDSIIQLDPTDVTRVIIDWEGSLETQLANLEKLRVDQENAIFSMEANIKNELASFDLKKIELTSSRFESERTRKIKELEFKQAEIRLAKEQRRLGLTKIIHENDMIIQKIRVRQMQNQIDDAYKILPELTIRTPISGVFQIAYSAMTGSLLKVGDEVYMETNMANVPDLEWMKVNTYINENDFLKIKVGQKVAVRLDAMSNVVFDGEISYIGKLCHVKNAKSKQKVFDVEVKMLKSDPRLKPGMTVSCEYLQN